MIIILLLPLEHISNTNTCWVFFTRFLKWNDSLVPVSQTCWVIESQMSSMILGNYKTFWKASLAFQNNIYYETEVAFFTKSEPRVAYPLSPFLLSTKFSTTIGAFQSLERIIDSWYGPRLTSFFPLCWALNRWSFTVKEVTRSTWQLMTTSAHAFISVVCECVELVFIVGRCQCPTCNAMFHDWLIFVIL
jgi:hypothetical protein